MSRKYIFLALFLCLIIITILGVSLTGFVTSPQVKEVEVKSAVGDLVEGNGKVLLEVKDNSTCYWIIPGRDEAGNFIEIREYGREYGACIGVPRSSTYIRTEEKVFMSSQGCVCDGSYILEESSGGLKITKKIPTQQTMSLGITEMMQNLLKVFKKK